MLLCLGFLGTARAQPGGFFNSSPNPLSQSHAELDNAAHCNDCHVNGTRELSNKQCRDCHDHQKLDTKIKLDQGFHASGLVKGKKCETCHKEHKKRDFDVMGWDRLPVPQKSFDHKLTGWPLEGKHANTDCAQCHKKKNKQGLVVYMGTDPLCGTCHAKDQPHKLVRTELLACEKCHGQSAWKPPKAVAAMKFDHDDRKQAGMPLLGAHKPLVNACLKCHPKAVFVLPFKKPDFCGNVGCHKSTHDGHLFGVRPCEWCHSPTFGKLKVTKFDHGQQAHFELGPKHDPARNMKIKCYDCHTKALAEVKPKPTCVQCHAKDNKHGDRFKQFGSPPACEVCHPSGGIKFVPTTFNHGARTKFPLTAKHQTDCRNCHRGKSPADFENFNGNTKCKGCHTHEIVHHSPRYPKGRWDSNKCLRCHLRPGDKSMRDPKQLEQEFHGPSSDFPLVKKHKGLLCEKCHKNRDVAKGTSFDEDESAECGDRCHKDELHKGTLGKVCTPCHSSGTWDALNFDHDKPFPDNDSYPLVGEHRKNTCEQCHPKRDFKNTPNTCSAEGCHKDDDAHKGRLGNKCEQCHVPTGDNLFNHNTMSAFRLDGKHLAVRCTDCHPSITFKPRPRTCFGCHPEPTVHKNQYGTTCEQCHTTRTWDDVKPLHDVGDFSLRGSHNSIACERCHRDNRPLAGSGNLCINCHRQDDIHNNSLSPRCGECHTQWAFAPARFDHSRVGCNLTGLHRTIACFDCHRNGNFTALSPQCAGCHRDDALRSGPAGANNGNTDHTILVACAICHNPNTWRPGGPGTPAVFNRESVCR